MDKKQATKLLKIAVVLYAASFLIINWSAVSWIFNYKEVYNLVEDFFNPYPGIDQTTMAGYFYPNHSQNTSSATIASQNENGTESVSGLQAKTTYTSKQNTLEIPAISIEAPIVFAQSSVKADITEDLNSGVVYYPGSVYPGQIGQIVILGHSAPAGWPKTKYEWVFSDLEDLEIGDEILIDLNNKQYTYMVKQTTIVARGEDVPTYTSDTSNSILTLISCWPPGKDYQRIAVQAELVAE